MSTVHIGLIGDYHADVIAHQAIPKALALAGAAVGVHVEPQWLATESLPGHKHLAEYHGLWAVPATPYRSMDGALFAIRYAREKQVPFFGSCGGFQHALIEYARSVLGWADAEHAETHPEGERLVISPLSCALVEVSGAIELAPGSRLAEAYGQLHITEGYHCRYGLNPEFAQALASGPLRITARDDQGDARGIELAEHPFFVGTLFQPERAALQGELPPIIRAFIEAVAEQPL
ncbi:CTP synthase [Pseudomonas sp. GV071]|jgi:CTP synthase (UTP-ammonia lyase)|uniref:CTP synthase C-terminal region-related (seleno)protein n=1 Tax=Pseudomonas sp. GV071 TaxID=2135754 RepID=UPI000D3B019C|nr:CTP synthase [Pseudomonas sp. GV071]PTQ67593.1 glutamine amidotransferase class I [Pseudomonas sp. GV071]